MVEGLVVNGTYLEGSGAVLERVGVAGVVRQTHNVTSLVSVREDVKVWEDLVELRESRGNKMEEGNEHTETQTTFRLKSCGQINTIESIKS